MNSVHQRLSSILIVAAIAAGASTPARAQTTASLRGQITATGSGLPVEGATVTLDLAPADQTFEFNAESGAFGFFKLDEIPAGTYTLAISHSAYVSAAPEMISFAAGNRINRTTTLTPLPDGPFFDVTAEVSGAVAGILLEGDPPNVFHQRVMIHQRPRDGVIEASGQIELWKLPPGAFRPIFVAVSQQGAAAVYTDFQDYSQQGSRADVRNWSRRQHGI